MAERTRVLVTFASKMGSTQEIAEVIGQGVAEPAQLVRMWTVGGVVPWASGVRNVFIQIIPHQITGHVLAARSA
jgi:hypothetical protein